MKNVFLAAAATSLRGFAVAILVTSGMAPAFAAPLPRENIVLKSALAVDPVRNTVVLPLHKGTSQGKAVWYIVTDSSDKSDAAKRGVIFSAVLANVGVVQNVSQTGDSIAFPSAPDFSARRIFVPGATGFPPADAKPGAVADVSYSPFIRINGAGPVLNAPIVATGDGPFDVTSHTNTAPRVLAVDTAKKTVSLLLAHGFSGGHEVVYISTEASDPGAATIERATYAPGLAKAGGKVPILVIVNGQTGAENPNAQGLDFAALDGNTKLDATSENSATLRASRNILSSFPTGSTAAGYSPLWDANVGVWSRQVIAAHENSLLKNQANVYQLAAAGKITAPDGKAFGPVGFVVNCPVVAYLDGAP